MAYKIFGEISQVPSPARLRALSGLHLASIIRPLRLVYGGADPVGYAMDYVAGAAPLARYFPPAYRAA